MRGSTTTGYPRMQHGLRDSRVPSLSSQRPKSAKLDCDHTDMDTARMRSVGARLVGASGYGTSYATTVRLSYDVGVGDIGPDPGGRPGRHHDALGAGAAVPGAAGRVTRCGGGANTVSRIWASAALVRPGTVASVGTGVQPAPEGTLSAAVAHASAIWH
jgi:hypothetical protein